MADGTFTNSKGHVNELHDRVAGNDPTNAGLVLSVLEANEVDATLAAYTALSTLLAAAGNTEWAATGYARIVLTDADISASSISGTTKISDIADPTFASVGPGNDSTKLLISYDPDTTSGTDADLRPMTHHDFAITPNGSNVVGTLSQPHYFVAS